MPWCGALGLPASLAPLSEPRPKACLGCACMATTGTAKMRKSSVEQVEVVPEERRVVEGGSEQEFVVRVSADGSGEVVVEETPSGGAAAPAVEIA